jgi:hypothetical protein
LRALKITAEIGTRTHNKPADLAGRQCLSLIVNHLDLDAGQGAPVGREGEQIVIIELDKRYGTVFRHAPR